MFNVEVRGVDEDEVQCGERGDQVEQGDSQGVVLDAWL